VCGSDGGSEQKKVKTMARTQTEVYGKTHRVLKALDEHAEPFTEGGLNVEAMRANLAGLIEQAIAADAHQEALKAQTMAATRTTVALNRRVDVTASSYLDMMIGAVQKDTPLAKTLRTIRSDIRREAPAATTQAPNPDATA